MATLFEREGDRPALGNREQGQVLREPLDEGGRHGWITVCSLIINRTIGSGIFVTPIYVIRATGSIGKALTLWGVGGIIAVCGTLVWNWFGLSIPRQEVEGVEGEHSLPQNGGEKNYLEWIYYRPQFLMSCIFAMLFIFLGNLSGNALVLGSYIMRAAGHTAESAQEPAGLKWKVIALAIAASTLAVLWHILSRVGGVRLNNLFAAFKITLLLAIIILGAVQSQGHLGGKEHSPTNFVNAWPTEGTRNAADYAQALTYVIYSYSGFEQPFYVLAECSNPRKIFPRYTIGTVAVITFLFLGVNVAFCLVVPKSVILDPAQSKDMATLFLTGTFANTEKAEKAMSALIAITIFGNILVMTFTASRVKQEIASEGILPWSLTWAGGWTTPYARYLKNAARKARNEARQAQLQQEVNQYRAMKTGIEFEDFQNAHQIRPDIPSIDEDFPEQTPLPALLLHLAFSIILILATCPLDSQDAYNLLVNLYSYVIVSLLGLLISGGLIYLEVLKHKDWKKISFFKSSRIGLASAIVYFAACGFVLFTRIKKPSAELLNQTRYPYYLVPVIGLTSPLWGVCYYGLLKLYEWSTNSTLVVSRDPFVIPDPDVPEMYLMKAEKVKRAWEGPESN